MYDAFQFYDMKLKCNEIELIFLISQNLDWIQRIIEIDFLHKKQRILEFTIELHAPIPP